MNPFVVVCESALYHNTILYYYPLCDVGDICPYIDSVRQQKPSCFVAAAPTCGDGVVEAGEACDDGNGSSGDGCSVQYMVKYSISV